MKLFKGFGIGFESYFKAIGFIFTKGLWWYFLFPVLLNILLIWGGWEFIGYLAEVSNEWLQEALGLKGEGEGFFLSGYLKDAMGAIVWVIFKVIYFIAFAFIGGFIVLILLSPVLAFLSEKTEKILTGREYPFSPDQLMRDVVRGVLIAMRNMFIEFFYIIIAFLLSFIPVIGWLASIALFLVSSYFYGFSFMDYYNERQKMSVSQSVKFIRKNSGIAIANGLVFSLFLLIPYCGHTLAGFAAIIATVAATISIHDSEKQKEIQAQNPQPQPQQKPRTE